MSTGVKGYSSHGFTLLELLVVVSVLAAISVVAMGAYRGVIEDSDDRLAYAEMQQLADAIRQFKRDTGYYPKEGPFAVYDGVSPGQVDVSKFKAYAGSNDSEKTRWFNSPANFIQLYVRPEFFGGSSLGFLVQVGTDGDSWDEETGRGWRGPYLKDFNDGYVDIGSEINEVSTTGYIHNEGIGGDPLEIDLSASHNVPPVPDVFGVADPYEHRAEGVVSSSVEDDLLDWSRIHRPMATGEPERGEIVSWGRPYLYFLQDASDDREISLVSMGPNGRFDNLDENEDDIQLIIE